jgi:hypothetical protein
MKTNIMLLLPIAFMSVVTAAAEETIPWDDIRAASAKYLNTCVHANLRTSMSQKMKDRTEQRIQDSNINEDQAAGDIMLEWASQNQGKLDRMEAKAVAQLCFYVVTFIDNGYYVPARIRGALTPSVVNKFLNHIDSEIRKRLAGSAPIRAG